MTPSTIPCATLGGEMIPVQEIKRRCVGAVQFLNRPLTAAEIWKFVDPHREIVDEVRRITINSLVFESHLVAETTYNRAGTAYEQITVYRLHAERRTAL